VLYTIVLLSVLLFGSVILGILEYYRHQKLIRSIPYRIHINGTRGKSSVTRLVGAGLREGGIKTITKVTGTYPRLILEDGRETEIRRKGPANIIEQLEIARYASKRNAQALVIECMALVPRYQWITENKMIHATVGAITNIRPDHLDVMGPTLKDVGLALGNTIPESGVLVTSEARFDNFLKPLADKRKSELVITAEGDVSVEEIRRFKYIEHRENVALALEICKRHGIDRETALRGMYKAIPDEGALTFFKVDTGEKQITFYNAMAANDPESSLFIWNKLNKEFISSGARTILLNTREDRMDRARQLTEMIGRNLNDEIDYLFLIGDAGPVVEGMAIKNGIDKTKIVTIDSKKTTEIYNRVLARLPEVSSIVAMGNMGGMGAVSAEYFKAQGKRNDVAFDGENSFRKN
jgi:poly-gamma-glutamate synthase PgsB/CapB